MSYFSKYIIVSCLVLQCLLERMRRHMTAIAAGQIVFTVTNVVKNSTKKSAVQPRRRIHFADELVRIKTVLILGIPNQSQNGREKINEKHTMQPCVCFNLYANAKDEGSLVFHWRLYLQRQCIWVVPVELMNSPRLLHHSASTALHERLQDFHS